MYFILLVLLLALVLGGVGFASHLVWIFAAIIFVMWLLGFAVRIGDGSRWYRW